MAVKTINSAVFISQMELLDHGLLTSAMEVEQYGNHLQIEMQDSDEIPDKVNQWVQKQIKGKHIPSWSYI